MTTTDPAAPRTPAEALDLDAIEARLDACDEPRAVGPVADGKRLVAEVRRLREQLENARGWYDLKEGELAGANAQRDQARAELDRWVRRFESALTRRTADRDRAVVAAALRWSATYHGGTMLGVLAEQVADGTREAVDLMAYVNRALSTTPPAGTEAQR